MDKESLHTRLDAALEVFGPQVKKAVFQELDNAGYSFTQNGDLNGLEQILLKIGGETFTSIVIKHLEQEKQE